MKLRLAWSLALAMVAAVPGTAAPQAQEYPNRTIRIVDPYAPGGSTDPIVRSLAQKMGEILGQAVYVEHKPGAGTNIGSDLVAKSKPDGYTVLFTSNTIATVPSLYRNLAYDPVKDLQPVASVINGPFVLAVSADLPIRSVQDLVNYARANPGKLNYGSAGNGGVIHLGMEQFKQLTKTDIVHVPFKGSGEVVTALLGGQIQVVLTPPLNLTQHVKAGRVRMLAVASAQRVKGLDLPTVAESGVPGFESGVWMGVFVPTGTPKSIVDKLNTTINQVLRDPQIVATYDRLGVVIDSGTADEFAQMYAGDVERWRRVIRAANLSLD